MAVKRKKPPRDPIQLAKLIGDIATNMVDDAEPDERNPAAVELGRARQKMAKGSRRPAGPWASARNSSKAVVEIASLYGL
jgi:hypothetical protein